MKIEQFVIFLSQLETFILFIYFQITELKNWDTVWNIGNAVTNVLQEPLVVLILGFVSLKVLKNLRRGCCKEGGGYCMLEQLFWIVICYYSGFQPLFVGNTLCI